MAETCRNCGGLVPEGAKYCPGCGAGLPGMAASGKRRRAHWARNSILVVLALVAGVYFAAFLIGVIAGYQESKETTERILSEAKRRLAEAAPQSSPTHGKWEASSDTSLLDGTKTVVLRLRAEKPITDRVGTPHIPTLMLRAERNAGQLLLSWNREAALVKTASKAVLAISDGGHKEDVELDLGQLRNGSIVYSPITNDVSFRLEVTDAKQGKSLNESIRVLLR